MLMGAICAYVLVDLYTRPSVSSVEKRTSRLKMIKGFLRIYTTFYFLDLQLKVEENPGGKNETGFCYRIFLFMVYQSDLIHFVVVSDFLCRWFGVLKDFGLISSKHQRQRVQRQLKLSY